MTALRTITPQAARRLAVARQHLAGPVEAPDRERMLQVVRDLGCLQLDPIRVVARSHELVLWSRLGGYDPADLAALRWEERRLFEYWAYRASIVLTEDYPIHHLLMRTYSKGDSIHRQRTRDWLAANRGLYRHVVGRLRERGPLRLREFEDRVSVGWSSSGWTNDRNVERMLDVLHVKGVAMVAGRSGNEKLWDLAERWFPDWTPRDRLPEREITKRAAQRSLRALGVGTARHIQDHFTAGRYPGLSEVLARLHRDGLIEEVRVEDEGTAWPGRWFVHAEDLPLLERIEAGGWSPRTTLLSPFDNLIIERRRARLMFGFDFTMEIYVPKEKRRFGYYVLPVLHGDRIVAKTDPVLDRQAGVLRMNAVHAEPNGPADRATGLAVRGAIEELATFLGAGDVAYGGPVPGPWGRILR